MPPSRTDLEPDLIVNNTLLSPFQGVKVPKTRSTIRATPNQLSELNKVFQNTTRPTKGVRESLSERTGLFVLFLLSPYSFLFDVVLVASTSSC